MAKDAETGKSKSQSKGLGHWRCSACGKATKVTVSKAVKEGTIETKTNA
jgi:tRNA(Ile2) C34 agmatinyltransferase TiaS